MPKISDQQRQARRDEILAAVWRCFLRKGVHGTSMEDLIRESGLSAGAVYLYYKGKHEIILAAISTYMEQLRSLLMPVLLKEEPLPPLSFMHEMVSAFAKHTKREGIDLNAVILMGWSEAQTNPAVKALVMDFQTRYRAAPLCVCRGGGGRCCQSTAFLFPGCHRAGGAAGQGRPGDVDARHGRFA